MSCAPGWNWGSMEEFWKRNLILHVVSGSRACGLARAGSDEDTRGVCIPPKEFLLGLQTFEQHENETQDHVVFALANFVRLALQANPNIIENSQPASVPDKDKPYMQRPSDFGRTPYNQGA